MQQTTHNADAVARWLAKGNAIKRQAVRELSPLDNLALALHDEAMEKSYNYNFR